MADYTGSGADHTVTVRRLQQAMQKQKDYVDSKISTVGPIDMQAAFKVGQLAFFVGSLLPTPTGDNKVFLFTATQLQDKMELSKKPSANNTAVFVSNGDLRAYGEPVYGAGQIDDNWYALMYRTISTAIRINCLVVVWGCN